MFIHIYVQIHSNMLNISRKKAIRTIYKRLQSVQFILELCYTCTESKLKKTLPSQSSRWVCLITIRIQGYRWIILWLSECEPEDTELVTFIEKIFSQLNKVI